jgi:hypothetical protein
MRKTVSGMILALLLVCLFTLSLKAQPIRAEQTIAPSPVSTYTETHVPVPFYYQEKDYYCGPAALQMVFNYYGENISQSEIACVARSIGDPLYVTYTDELRRAGHFSNISTSMGDELSNNITGYTLRQLGYAAFESQGVDLTTVKSFLDQGKPLILLMWYSSYHHSGHFRVATGYNETHVFLHDPWNKPSWGGTYGGPNLAFNNSQFSDLWSYSGNWALYVSPWTVNFSAPSYVTPGTPFQIESTVTYPQPPLNVLSPYPASSCNASIVLPANLSLAQGENQKKTVGTGLLQAGDSSTLQWTLIANSSVTGTVSITVEGMISGVVGAHANYTAYSYTDRTGATVNFTVNMAPPTHDVGVTNVLASKTIVGQGCSLNVSVAAADPGGYPETFNLTVYANTTSIASQNVTLSTGDSTTITLTWTTTGFAYGNYTLSAYAWPVPGETNTANNNFTDGPVKVTITGDVDGDSKVDMTDLMLLLAGFGSRLGPDGNYWHKPPCSWCPHSPNLDLDNNGQIDMTDIFIALNSFGRYHPYP